MPNSALGFFTERFAIDAKLMNDILGVALSAGGDYADLFFEHRTTSSILFEEQAVKNAGSGVVQGVGIRVVHGDATGYAYTEDLTPEAMRLAAETAARIANRRERVGPIGVALRPVADLYPVRVPAWEAPAAEKLAIIRRADEAARAFDPMIQRVVVSFADEVKHVAIATSDGTLVEDLQPMIRIHIQCLSEKGKERQTAIGGGGGRLGLEYFERSSPEDLARDVARQAVLLQSAVEAPAGFLPVVLGAGDSGILLHEAVGHGLEADFNRKRTSNYADRVGQSVASSLVTVVDDGTVPNSRGTINVDDEGNAPCKNVLIEEGMLQGYMQDRISARHFGVAPSGNGRRESFHTYPMPRMTNTYMLPGESDREEIIRSVDRGLYCLSYSGGQVNISNGDFVFSVTEAYMIEGGRVTTPVKGVTLIGNGPDTLSKVTMVGADYQLSDGRWTCGKDGQSVPVGVGMPTVLVSGITVGGTKNG
ncbi:MAG TPA: metallopeptidase TldD-related protein [Chloroflexota bacterium]|nr:metallopeptidase TldD-related protein [Chloroflexota bacterium]